ncbi:MAG: hypothetical protein AB7S65_06110 [Sulfuricurvum sp.]
MSQQFRQDIVWNIFGMKQFYGDKLIFIMSRFAFKMQDIEESEEKQVLAALLFVFFGSQLKGLFKLSTFGTLEEMKNAKHHLDLLQDYVQMFQPGDIIVAYNGPGYMNLVEKLVENLLLKDKFFDLHGDNDIGNLLNDTDLLLFVQHNKKA